MNRLILLALVASPVLAAQEQPEPVPRERRLKELLAEGKDTLRGKVTAVANEIGLVVISIGKDDGVREGDEFTLAQKGAFLARGVVDRADRKWAALKIVLKKSAPAVGDDALRGGRFTLQESKAFADYAFSFHPLTDEDRTRVKELLGHLESDDIAAREAAARDLVKLGGPARAALSILEPGSLGAEARARIADVLKEMDRINEPLQSPGLERDLEYLALVDDPRGYDRLKRILSGVHPFSVAGFPEKRAGLTEYVLGWWAYSKDRMRWNPEADRYEDR